MVDAKHQHQQGWLGWGWVPTCQSPRQSLAPACSKCRDSTSGGLTALTGLISPQTPTMSRSWGLACCTPRSSSTLGAGASLCTEAAGALQGPPLLRQSHCHHLCLGHQGCRYPSQEGPYRCVQVGHRAVPEQIAQDIDSRHWEVPATLQSN